MEVWILLAAAGSGYLARRWQNAQKPKGSSADEAENDASAGPSNQVPSYRGQYRHFSSSVRRQVGKSVCGKGSPHWVRQHTRNTGNATEHATGVTNADHSGEKVLEDLNHDGAPIGDLEGNDRSEGFNPFAQQESAAQDEGTEEKILAYKPLSRSVSGKRANDDDALKSGYLHAGGYMEKRMKDEMDSTSSQRQGFVFESWMPGFWDVSEGIFVLNTNSLLAQQEIEARNKGTSSARRLRTPNKYGRSRGTRRKNLTAQKPMSSLESCLSAQFDEDYNIKATRSRAMVGESINAITKTLGSSSSSGVESSLACDERPIKFSRADSVIGLPPLSQQPNSGKSWKDFTLPSCSVGQASKDACRTFPEAGSAGFSLEGLLFNFGVGVGMMFTVMSNMREVRRLTVLLREAELLIKDLENELKQGDNVAVDLVPAGEITPFEHKQGIGSGSQKKIRNTTQSLSSMMMLLKHELGTVPTIEQLHSKDISVLEAELEAELERMQLSCSSNEDRFKVQRKSSDSTKDAGNVVQGKLTTAGRLHDIEIDTDNESGSDSSHEDFHVRGYAVSPRELTRRLHEVLEARQEERISDLEAELKLMGSKLQAKQKELQLLKKMSMGLLRDNDQILTRDDETHENMQSHVENILMEDQHPPISCSRKLSPTSPNNSPYPINIVPSKSCNFFKKGLENKSGTAFITLGGEALAAYKEACEEFSKISSELGSPHVAIGRSTQDNDFYGGDCVKVLSGKEFHYDRLIGKSDACEQVDLLSLAEDFYIRGDPDLKIPTLGPINSKRRYSSRRGSHKGGVLNHPEPEQHFSSSRGVDSSDDATNETSGSTPCSIKFMDVSTAGFCQREDPQVETEENCTPFSNWNQEVLSCGREDSSSQEEFHSGHPDILPVFKLGDGDVPDNDGYSSELDEQLGQLLIKRIVEKSRKGSPIIQEAQTILASLERVDTL